MVPTADAGTYTRAFGGMDTRGMDTRAFGGMGTFVGAFNAGTYTWAFGGMGTFVVAGGAFVAGT